jgi:hypothetical protein
LSEVISVSDRVTRSLSWVAALLCAHYIGWGCYQVRWQVPFLAQLYAGLGAELPLCTRLVIAISNRIFLVGLILILLVVGKELLIRDIMIRLEITFILFLSAAWLFDFSVTAMLGPALRLLAR